MESELQQSDSRVCATVRYTVQPTIIIVMLVLEQEYPKINPNFTNEENEAQRSITSQDHKVDKWLGARLGNRAHMTSNYALSTTVNKFQSRNIYSAFIGSRLSILKILFFFF